MLQCLKQAKHASSNELCEKMYENEHKIIIIKKIAFNKQTVSSLQRVQHVFRFTFFKPHFVSQTSNASPLQGIGQKSDLRQK